MGKQIKIGLFGVALESVNYGVTALALTQIAMLHRIEKELGIKIEYLIFADDSPEAEMRVKQLLNVNNITRKYIVRIKTGLKGIKRLKKDIQMCDLIIDLTYGDSFSDIYGIKSFFLYSIPKIIAICTKTLLIIAPQTIGPFYNKWIELIATYLLKKADFVLARDDMSFKYVEKLTHRKDLIVTSDLAMELPYKNLANINYVDRKINVGLNVSLMLWEKDKNNSNSSISLSYKRLIDELLLVLKAEGYAVHLIAHVYDKRTFTEYSLAEELCKEYENTILAPRFTDPIDVKNYIAKLDCFIGSRMHATIGAFSSGVPIIPIAYSRKFEGLYGALGYNHCIDCSGESVESAISLIMEKLHTLDELRKDCEIAYLRAIEENKKYYAKLKDICRNLLVGDNEN